MKKSQTYFLATLTALVCLAVLETAGYVLLKRHAGYPEIRQFLRGQATAEQQPQLTAHPYLNYIPTPEYTSHGHVQHNREGFRGPEIELAKNPDRLRILFLGGSTTYNVSVSDPDSTLSEQVKDMLLAGPALYREDGTAWTGVETMNGGLPWGTSFEALSAYLYKYRYYQPDLVVIHSGGNDAQSYLWGGQYQADYSHWRTTFNSIEPLPKGWRRLCASRLVSYLVINGFYKRYTDGGHYVHYGDKTPAQWYNDTTFLENPGRNAYYRNLRTLGREVSADGARLLLVPFIANAGFEHNPEGYIEGIAHNNGLMKSLHEKYGWAFCAMGPELIDSVNPKLWLDDCHLPAAGVKLKAAKISECIVGMFGAPSVQ